MKRPILIKRVVVQISEEEFEYNLPKYVSEQDKYIDYLEAKVKNLGLFDVRLSLPTPEPWQMYTKAHELDEKEFEQWLFDFGK